MRIPPRKPAGKWPRLLLLGLLAPGLVCCIVLFALLYRPQVGYLSTAVPSATIPPVPSPSPAVTLTALETYLKEYGGNPDVYLAILASTDCAWLQSQFDQAYTNNQIATPGNPAFSYTLGYMTAVNARMVEIGCFP